MKKLSATLLILSFLIGCASKSDDKELFNEKNGAKTVKEVESIELKLAGRLSERDSEISGLAWMGNELVFLTQYPGKFGSNEVGVLWKISKEKIYEAINNPQLELVPEEIELKTNSLGKIINSRGSGLEAVVFDSDSVWLSIENSESDLTNGIIVKGILNKNRNSIQLLPESQVKISHSVNIPNYSEETMTQFKNTLITIFEGNGRLLNPDACAHLINKKTLEVKKIKMPHMEYRITDATEVDENGDFWVINYFYPGDLKKMKLDIDSIIVKNGIGETHKINKQVERLVKLNFDGEKIIITDVPPVQLKLEQGRDSNNWEGLVKLDDKGFLMIADYYPYTKFVFVPYSDKKNE